MADVSEILEQAQRLVLQHRDMMAGDVVDTVEEALKKLDKPDVIELIAPAIGGKEKTVEILAAVRKFVALERYIQDQSVEENALQFIMKAKEHKILLRLLDAML